MKDFNIVVARIPNSFDGLLVVPFNDDDGPSLFGDTESEVGCGACRSHAAL